ncbi:hypothetical protein ACFX15_012015 [Malus domestica]
MADLLSFPSHIVDHIVSLLSLADAVQTSILSRNWYHIWTRIRVLNFNPQSSLEFYSAVHMDADIGTRNQEIARFVRWVENTIWRHTGATIKTFHVVFPLNVLQQALEDS